MQEQGLGLRQEQKQILTPAQLQALSLLALPVQELSEFINEQLLENPVLELAEPEEAEHQQAVEPPRSGRPEDDSWQEPETNVIDYEEWGYGAAGGTLMRETAAEQNTLVQQLLLQAAFLPAEGEVLRAVKALIYALDSDGYLRIPLDELAESLGIDEGLLAEGLALLQTLEPHGIAARDLRECLLLQIPTELPQRELMAELIGDWLPQLAQGQIKTVAQGCNISEAQAERALDFIRTLEPRPGAALSSVGAVQYIVPDLSVTMEHGQLTIRLNDSIRTRLTVNSYYEELAVNSAADNELSDYLRQRLTAARMLIRNIERRHNTIAALAELVFSRQRDFFSQGAMGLKPLTMKEAAQLVQVHESTVSRTVAGKYVETPRGLLSWKYFFPRPVELDDGGRVSDSYAKALIARLIRDEDRRRPLSDRELAEALQQRGLMLARRTVTKYRLALDIPGQSQRKQRE